MLAVLVNLCLLCDCKLTRMLQLGQRENINLQKYSDMVKVLLLDYVSLTVLFCNIATKLCYYPPLGVVAVVRTPSLPLELAYVTACQTCKDICQTIREFCAIGHIVETNS